MGRKVQRRHCCNDWCVCWVESAVFILYVIMDNNVTGSTNNRFKLSLTPLTQIPRDLSFPAANPRCQLLDWLEAASLNRKPVQMQLSHFSKHSHLSIHRLNSWVWKTFPSSPSVKTGEKSALCPAPWISGSILLFGVFFLILWKVASMLTSHLQQATKDLNSWKCFCSVKHYE